MHVCAEKICAYCGHRVTIDQGFYPNGREITVNLAAYQDGYGICKHCQHYSYLVKFTMKPPEQENASE